MLKKLPLEAYILFLPAAITYIIFHALSTPLYAVGIKETSQSIGISFIVIMCMFALCALYAVYVSCSLIYKKNFEELKKFLFSLSFLIIYVNCVILIVFDLTSLLFFHINPVHIIPIGDVLMSIDYKLFHTYSGILIQNIFSADYVRTYIVYCYGYLFPVITFTLIIALIKNVRIFRLGILSLLLAFYISIPLWMLNPTLPPLNMYYGSKPFAPASIYTKDFSNFKIASTLEKQMLELKKFWVSDDNSWYGVSTNPSMHIAWGLITVIIAFLI